MGASARLDLIRKLQARVCDMEHAARPARADVLGTGSALERLLPLRGWRRGSITEWLVDGAGGGALTLALVHCGLLVRHTGVLVVVDGARCFYPRGAAGLGVGLEQLVVVRPRSRREGLWALEQALRSPAGAAVLGWFERLEERVYRRLQLAAEAGGSVGMLVRPARYRQEPSWAETRLLVRPGAGAAAGRRWRVEWLAGRGPGGAAVDVECNDETHPVCVVAGLADPASAAQAAGA